MNTVCTLLQLLLTEVFSNFENWKILKSHRIWTKSSCCKKGKATKAKTHKSNVDKWSSLITLLRLSTSINWEN